MNWWAVFFSFSGRINRAKYWLGVLAFYLSIFAAIYVSYLTGIGSDSALVLLLPACWMHFAVAVKRIHDLDKPGWWVILWLFIPGGQLILGVLEGTSGANRYGADPLSTWRATATLAD
jgi:uncharacterized membrane protein YhaH (DUF805 family)